jgi:predicted dehydrogenase
MSKHDLKWGILGTARIAQNALIPALKASRRNSVHAVASRSITKAQEYAQLNGIPVAYGSYEELLQDEAIQAVYIPLPNNLHKEYAIAALKAGKHVLCEKPIGLNQHEAQEMVAFAEESGFVLMEGFMYRYHPRFKRYIDLIEDGVIGNIRFIHSAFSFNITNPNDIRLIPELGGGALMDVGCYCIDISRQLTNREPLSVQAQYYESNTGIDLQIAVTMDFGDNIFSQFEVAFNTFARQECRVAGNQGSLEIFTPFKSEKKFTKAILTTKEYQRTLWNWPKNEYKEMVDHFNRLAAGKEKRRYPLTDSIADMKVIDAIMESALADGAFIHLDATQADSILEDNQLDQPLVEELEHDGTEPEKEPVD